jgi:perosamine synthetase
MTELIELKRKIPIAIPSLSEEEWLAIKEPLMSGWLTQGPKVAEFEKNFALYHNVEHAVAVTSCTTGLHLALLALGVGEGDEVIVPAFTWIATANAVLYCGAKPIFCDVDPRTYNINIDDIISKITKKTKAIIVVHLFGLCVDVDSIRKILPEHIKIIEDAACAAGASYNERFAGSLGDIGVFSFHPRKSITTGEGGMITTNSSNYANKIDIMRNHGAELSEELRHNSTKPYLLPDFKTLGYNYRMTDLQAAVGLIQLKKLEMFISQRQTFASYYTESFREISWLKPQLVSENCTQHAWQAYVLYVDPNKAPMPRNEIMALLQERGIATRPGTHAVHMLSYYKEKYQIKSIDFPGAKQCDENTMAIPLHNKMNKDDFDYIISEIKNLNV